MWCLVLLASAVLHFIPVGQSAKPGAEPEAVCESLNALGLKNLATREPVTFDAPADSHTLLYAFDPFVVGCYRDLAVLAGSQDFKPLKPNVVVVIVKKDFDKVSVLRAFKKLKVEWQVTHDPQHRISQILKGVASADCATARWVAAINDSGQCLFANRFPQELSRLNKDSYIEQLQAAPNPRDGTPAKKPAKPGQARSEPSDPGDRNQIAGIEPPVKVLVRTQFTANTENIECQSAADSIRGRLTELLKPIGKPVELSITVSGRAIGVLAERIGEPVVTTYDLWGKPVSVSGVHYIYTKAHATVSASIKMGSGPIQTSSYGANHFIKPTNGFYPASVEDPQTVLELAVASLPVEAIGWEAMFRGVSLRQVILAAFSQSGGKAADPISLIAGLARGKKAEFAVPFLYTLEPSQLSSDARKMDLFQAILADSKEFQAVLLRLLKNDEMAHRPLALLGAVAEGLRDENGLYLDRMQDLEPKKQIEIKQRVNALNHYEGVVRKLTSSDHTDVAADAKRFLQVLREVRTKMQGTKQKRG